MKQEYFIKKYSKFYLIQIHLKKYPENKKENENFQRIFDGYRK